jgi:hypothetical protein
MESRIIEINGIKMEIDLREATVVDSFKVGDQVKILVSKYGGTFESKAGAIVGFDNFKERPTIIVAYLEVGYSEASVKFAYINSDTKDVEIIKANEQDLPFDQSRVLDLLNRDIDSKQQAYKKSLHARVHFLEWFGRYFKNFKETKDGQ